MIQTYLSKILNAVYGKDVRQAIHDAIHQCYEDGKSGELDLIAREGVEEIKANIANPNLLINGDFRNPVNQRGKTTYNEDGWAYTIDRWRTNNASVIVNDGSITITNNSDTDAHFQQVFEKNLYNDVYTASCEVVAISGKVRMYYNEYSQELAVGENTFTFNANSHNFFAIILEKDASVTLKWAKLEHGKIATPQSPRPYAEELMMCQRYYQLISPYKIGMYANTETMTLSIPLLQMRATPNVTITRSGDSNIGKLEHWVNQRMLQMFITASATGRVQTSLTIELDAEIK